MHLNRKPVAVAERKAATDHTAQKLPRRIKVKIPSADEVKQKVELHLNKFPSVRTSVDTLVKKTMALMETDVVDHWYAALTINQNFAVRNLMMRVVLDFPQFRPHLKVLRKILVAEKRD